MQNFAQTVKIGIKCILEIFTIINLNLKKQNTLRNKQCETNSNSICKSLTLDTYWTIAFYTRFSLGRSWWVSRQGKCTRISIVYKFQTVLPCHLPQSFLIRKKLNDKLVSTEIF